MGSIYHSRDLLHADSPLTDGTPGLLAGNELAYGKRLPQNRKARRLVKQFRSIADQLNRTPWYACDRRKALTRAMNNLVFRMAIAMRDHDQRKAGLERCHNCGKLVTPIIHSTGGMHYNGCDVSDDIHDFVICPECGCDMEAEQEDD